jgi:hypothetical protein
VVQHEVGMRRGVVQAHCRMPALDAGQTRAARAAAPGEVERASARSGSGKREAQGELVRPRRLGSNAAAVNAVAAAKDRSAAIPRSGAQPSASTGRRVAGSADARCRAAESSRLTGEPTRGQSCQKIRPVEFNQQRGRIVSFVSGRLVFGRNPLWRTHMVSAARSTPWA